MQNYDICDGIIYKGEEYIKANYPRVTYDADGNHTINCPLYGCKICYGTCMYRADVAGEGRAYCMKERLNK